MPAPPPIPLRPQLVKEHPPEWTPFDSDGIQASLFGPMEDPPAAASTDCTASKATNNPGTAR